MNFFREKKWPIPDFKENEQPHFLFIVTPPNSGSTSISGILNSSHQTMILHPKGEGQWIVPGLCEKDRWDPDKDVNFDSVKATWLEKFQSVNELVQDIQVVIEKSPPNMVRLEQIIRLFDNYSLLANNRDPYANCASILYRRHSPHALTPEQREKKLVELTDDWVYRSKKIMELINKFDIPLITYEQFCANPELLLTKLSLPPSVIDTLNVNAEVVVKDYKSQIISNQNERQIEKLTPFDIKTISDRLKLQRELVSYFKYEIR